MSIALAAFAIKTINFSSQLLNYFCLTPNMKASLFNKICKCDVCNVVNVLSTGKWQLLQIIYLGCIKCMYVYRFQDVFLRCPTPRLHCFLSSHWPSFRFLSFMAFLISSIQFFFGLPRALFTMHKIRVKIIYAFRNKRISFMPLERSSNYVYATYNFTYEKLLIP